MKKSVSKIRGYKKRGDQMSCDKSYDFAYKLTEILRNSRDRFTSDEKVIMYPSSWYEGYFEITFRNKNNSEGHIELSSDIIKNIVTENMPEGWVCYDEEWYGLSEGSTGTPAHLKFCPENMYDVNRTTSQKGVEK